MKNKTIIMKVKSGNTRHVILLKNFVIKIPRIKCILFFKRFLKHKKNPGEIKATIEKLNIDLKYIIKYIFSGFIANYNEYRYSKSNPNKRGIIPVRYLILGIILIQYRGKELKSNDKKWKDFLEKIVKKGVLDGDMLTHENYSIWKNIVCLHDYGKEETIKNLNFI